MKNLSTIFFILIICGCGNIESKVSQNLNQKFNIDSLINCFKNINVGDVGYHPSYSSKEKFYPIDSGKYIQPMVWGEKGAIYEAPESFMPLFYVIANGWKSLPFLFKHLNDTTPTAYEIKHRLAIGGIFYYNLYDFNGLTQTDTSLRNTVNDKSIKTLFNAIISNPDEQRHKKYIVRVADICFVAIGQIMNRNFSCVRYQPSAIIVINSPLIKPELKSILLHEMRNMTQVKHIEWLLNDFKNPDYPWRQVEAFKRLKYYYPNEIEKLINSEFKYIADSLNKEIKIIKF